MQTRQLLVLLFSFFIVPFAYAQDADDILISSSLDLVKTDNIKFAGKAQIGLEAKYFVTKDFAVSTGFEIWTGDEFSFVVGGRYYPAEEAFIRLRGFIGKNDLNLGAGWTKPLNDHFKFEAIGDFYFSIDFAIRVGLVYIIKR